ncbi:lysylphosphatidylglycerol synthase transmembrane domain-containing protein [Oceaniglobus trochenteri]|uniref:lysylphosphatidylglycerol synthase transmembrane domain-containing protein n=1 Tax=Oceaniglobus trochenteri TaxID=2763260 RepID=UPI001CFFD9FB|nr:lysylphosphatidylglycerol synthase transmembrane domain-containing protein [Oceaniglobus trochenteri]
MSSTSPAPRARPTRDRLILAALVVLLLVGLAGLAGGTGWSEISAQIARIEAWQIGALLGLSLLNYLFRALRWHVFARRLGLRTSIHRNILHFIGGFAMSVTPGRVGELVRMRWLYRETGWSFERTAPLALIDRASDLAAMGILLAIALSLSATGIAGGLPVTLLALTGAFVATRPALLSGIATGLHRLTGRFARLMVRLRRAARALARFSNPTIIGAATMLGLVGWLAEGLSFHLLLVWLGHDIGLAKAIAIFIFATLAGGLTGAPGGLGGAEAAMIALLSLEGVPLAVSVPATAIIRLTTLWFAIALGLVAFPVAERISRKAAHALEDH